MDRLFQFFQSQFLAVSARFGLLEDVGTLGIAGDGTPVTWNLNYKRRTTAERTNKREKIDYKLESGRHRSTAMWYIRIYGIMMCQHMDAWYAHLKEDLKNLQQIIYPLAAA